MADIFPSIERKFFLDTGSALWSGFQRGFPYGQELLPGGGGEGDKRSSREKVPAAGLRGSLREGRGGPWWVSEV